MAGVADVPVIRQPLASAIRYRDDIIFHHLALPSPPRPSFFSMSVTVKITHHVVKVFIAAEMHILIAHPSIPGRRREIHAGRC